MPTPVTSELPDIVQRAEAILQRSQPARQDPVGARAPFGPASLPELQQRALALVNDVFAALGTAAPGLGGGAAVPVLPGIPAAAPSGLAKLATGSVPWQLPSAVGAGQRTLVPVVIENAGPRALDTGFFSTDLLSDTGRSIPGHQVSFDPPRLTLAPGERGNVTARVEVPLQAAPGAYSGLVQASGLPANKTVITVQVV
jgi:hypothetical protein